MNTRRHPGKEEISSFECGVIRYMSDCPAQQLSSEKVDPRIATRNLIQLLATHSQYGIGLFNRIFNEWPRFLSDHIFFSWVKHFNFIISHCDIDSDNTELDADTTSGMRGLLKDMINQAIEDSCDEDGKIKSGIALALNLACLKNRDEQSIIAQFIQGYLTNQICAYLTTEATVVATQGMSDEQTIEWIQKVGLVQQYISSRSLKLKCFMEQLHEVISQENLQNCSGLLIDLYDRATDLTDATSEEKILLNKIIIPLTQFKSEVDNRMKTHGYLDPLYQSSQVAYLQAYEVAQRLITSSKINMSEVGSFKSMIEKTTKTVNDPLKLETQYQLSQDIQNAPNKKSNGWAMLGASLLIVLGVAAMVAGCIGSSASMGATALLGCKIAGICFAAAGVIWGVAQCRQAGVLASSMSKFFGACRDPAELSNSSLTRPLLSPSK